MADSHTRGGTHEQHVKAGEQSHKSTTAQSGSGKHEAASKHDSSGAAHGGTQGGSHEHHVKAGQQSHKNG